MLRSRPNFSTSAAFDLQRGLKIMKKLRRLRGFWLYTLVPRLLVPRASPGARSRGAQLARRRLGHRSSFICPEVTPVLGYRFESPKVRGILIPLKSPNRFLEFLKHRHLETPTCRRRVQAVRRCSSSLAALSCSLTSSA